MDEVDNVDGSIRGMDDVCETSGRVWPAEREYEGRSGFPSPALVFLDDENSPDRNPPDFFLGASCGIRADGRGL